jgi:hypothetical protein
MYALANICEILNLVICIISTYKYAVYLNFLKLTMHLLVCCCRKFTNTHTHTHTHTHIYIRTHTYIERKIERKREREIVKKL